MSARLSGFNKTLCIQWAASTLAGLAWYLLVLAGLGMLLLPRLVSETDLQALINERLARTLQAETTIGALELHMLPAPNLALQDIVFTIPQIGLARCPRLRVFPDLPALLTGRLRLDLIEIDRPEIRMERWPQAQASSEEPPDVQAALQRLPRLTLRINQGTASLRTEALGAVQLSRLDAGLQTGGRVQLTLRGDSNLAKDILLRLEAARDASAAEGTIRAKDVELTRFAPFLPSLPAGMRLAACRLDLDASWSFARGSGLQAEMQGAVPSLGLAKGSAAHRMKIGHYQGSLHWSPERMGLRLDKLAFLEPAMDLSGGFHLEQSEGFFRLQASGKDIPIEPVRAICQDFIGHKEKVARVLDIVRGGRAAEVAFSGSGRTLEDLESSLRISGRLEEGRIHVPKLDLDLKEVQGTYAIEDKTLSVEDIAADLDRTRILKAELELGLNKELQPLRLSCNLDADLAQGPPIMRKVIEHRTFLRHLGRISGLQGRGRGTLRVVRDQEQRSVEVDLHGVSLQATYGPLPFPVRITRGNLHYEDHLLRVRGVDFTLSRSAFRGVDGSIQINADPVLQIKQAAGSLALGELVPWLRQHQALPRYMNEDVALEGTLEIAGLRFQGPLFRPPAWDFKATGTADGIRCQQPMLPGTIRIAHGGFQVDETTLILDEMLLGQRESEATLSGEIHRYLQFPPSLKLNVRGRLDAEELAWIWHRFSLPKESRLQPPVDVQQLNISWQPQNRFSVTGQLKVGHAVQLRIDLAHFRKVLALNHLYIEDKRSRARVELQIGPRQARFLFSGSLLPETAERLLSRNTLLKGSLQGNFETDMELLPLAVTSAQGKLDIYGFSFPKSLVRELALKDVSLEAAGGRVDVQRARVFWRGSSFDLDGEVALDRKGNRFELIMQGDRLSWDTLRDMVSTPGERQNMDRVLSRMEGSLHFDLGRFAWQGFDWTRVQGDLHIESQGKIDLDIQQADLCGIDTNGSLHLAPAPLSLDVRAQAQGKDLQPTLACLYEGERDLSGSFDVSSRIKGQGQNGTALAADLGGPLRFTSQDGRIYRLDLLAKIFGVLNTTEIFFGELPDLEKKGFGYNAITVEADVKGHKLLLNKGLIDGKTMELGFQGEVHLTERTLDLIVLVAPLKTVDRIVKKIPILSHIMGGTLVSIPFRVSGDLDDPRITPLSPKAVGSEVFDIMKRTLELPVKIFQPFMPDKE